MFTEILNQIDGYVWGLPLIVLLLGTGVLLTFRLRLLQVWKLPKALALIFTARNGGGGDVNSFKALCTALAGQGGRPRRPVLDVDRGLLRHGDQVC